LVVGILTGVALRFVNLGGQSLWTDEMLTIRNAFIGQKMTASDIFGNLQGPAVSLIVHHMGGLSIEEWFLRLPFAVAGTLTVLAMYLLTRYLMGGWVSLNTTLFVSLAPVLVWYSQEVRGYSFVVLCSVLMTYCLVRWVKTHKGRDLSLYSVLLFAGLVSNLSAAFVAFAHLLYLVAFRNTRRLAGRWIVAVFVVLLVFSPWVRQIMLRVQPERVVTGESAEPLTGGARFSVVAVPYTLFTYGVGYSLGPSVRQLQTRAAKAVIDNAHWVILASVAFVIPAIVGLRKMIGEDARLLCLLLLMIAIPLLAVAVLSLRNIRVFTPRYALVAFPAYAMIVGRGLSAITRSRWWPFTLLFVALLGVSLYNYFSVPAYAKDDARAVAGTIKENFGSEDAIVAIYASAPLAHYLDGFADVETFGANDMESGKTMKTRCAAIAAGGERVWLSLCREWQVDPDGVIHGWFEENMALARSFEFPGMRLYLYEKRSG
jgi:4-amino-4-deoxy-L-arabinose transferase-like glycosyltransferase